MKRVPLVDQLARSIQVLNQLTPFFDQPDAAIHPTRAILFDKAPHANWYVGWHQDQAVAVNNKPEGAVLEKLERIGFGPWSIKDDIVHVEPPENILASMVTLRLHLDDCDKDDGPLRVLPGSHAQGRLTVKQVKQKVADEDDVVCNARAGDALLMSPLLLHASSRVNESAGRERDFRRRVIHIEYAATQLPEPLRWCG